MSQAADIQRSAREKFAAPGGRHDRLIRVLRVLLPSVIGALLAVLAFSPFANNREMSFVLAKDEVNKAKERMRVNNALYRGEDSKGRPFTLSAGSAVQKSSSEPVVRMSDLMGRLAMDNGPASISAAQGYYDMDAEKVQVEGPLSFSNSDGFNLTATNVQFLLKPQTMQSLGPVSGSTRVGTFRAGRMTADVEKRIVRLEGGAQLQINQGAIR
jgi:lipopolysaccharide export system protein LptC